MSEERIPQVDDSVDTLLSMLMLCRPAGSLTEREFIRRFIIPTGAKLDKRGNAYLRIGTAPVLWSSHTDTVHNRGGQQTLCQVGTYGIGVSKSCDSNCLGADDTAGVWLMLELIRAKVEGLYIFHRAEEVGCVGSRFIAKNTPKMLEGIKYAIALDRRDKKDIITFQSGTRCCSDEFAKSIGDQLGMGYEASTFGSFTDTASYTGLVPECTNLSVGYTGAHSKHEELDGQHLIALRNKLWALDLTKLVEKRQAGTVEHKTYQSTTTYYPDYGEGGYYGGFGGGYYGRSNNNSNYHIPGSNYPQAYPRAGQGGWWDANMDYHHYDDVEDLQGNVIWEGWKGGQRPFPPALKAEELLKARKAFWKRAYTETKRKQSNLVVYRRPDAGVTKMAPGSHVVPALRKRKRKAKTTVQQDETFFVHRQNSRPTLAAICQQHPAEVADFLEFQGYDAHDIALFILDSGIPLRGYGH